MKSMITRFFSGIVYIAIIVFGIYSRDFFSSKLAGFLVFVAVTFFLALVGVWEVYHNLEIKGEKCDKTTGLLVGIITFGCVSAANFYGYRFPYINLTLLTLISLVSVWSLIPLRQLWRHDENPFQVIGNTILPLFWVVLPLLTFQIIGNRSLGLLMMVFICTWSNDTGAYLSGRAFGKHHMWERHSPKKTWEGTIGGLILCVAAALLLGPLFEQGLSWWYWCIIAIICTVFGTLGDLVESMFKRSCGVKDSGTIMPGHGGILDRIDSILFIAPAVTAVICLGLIW